MAEQAQVRIYTILEAFHEAEGVRVQAVYVAATNSQEAVREWATYHGAFAGTVALPLAFVQTDESMQESIDHGANPRVLRPGRADTTPPDVFERWARNATRTHRDGGAYRPATFRKVSLQEVRILSPRFAEAA